MVATSKPMSEYAAPEVPTEKGYDQTDVPSEHANEAPAAVPTHESVAQETAVKDDDDDSE